MAETQWPTLMSDTVGPYEVTAKENGCIIFVAALEGDLVVMSKHMVAVSSATPMESGKPPHGVAGEQRLDSTLSENGKTRAQLADFLAHHKVTAVFEVRDLYFLCETSVKPCILTYIYSIIHIARG